MSLSPVLISQYHHHLNKCFSSGASSPVRPATPSSVSPTPPPPPPRPPSRPKLPPGKPSVGDVSFVDADISVYQQIYLRLVCVLVLLLFTHSSTVIKKNERSKQFQ